MNAPAERPAGQIYDLGYKRYAGTRRAPSTRWRSIARNQIALAWKTWWRFKAALGLAVITTCITGGVMVLASDNMSSVGRAQPLVMLLIDSALPESIIWFCRVGFVLSLTIGATVVASDLQSGAFTFYFARSVKPRHYVIGKLVGLCALVALLVAAGPLVIASLRLGISESTDELVRLLPLIPKTLAIGAIATLVYAAVPLGFSALLGSRRNALALWAAYYLIFGGMAWIVGKTTSGPIAALDLPQSIKAVAYWLYDVQYRPWDPQIPLEAAIASLSIHVVASIAIVAYQVRRAHLSGVGGSS
jgi:ABC-type transport system involved in multi-copper enzyme maturation permease subunit